MTLDVFKERFNDLLFFSEKTGVDFSKESGLVLKSVHKWIEGSMYPSPKSLLVIADFFKVSTDYILGLDNDEEEKKRKKVTIEEANEVLVQHLNAYLEEQEIKKNRMARLLDINSTSVLNWFKGSMPETASLIKIATLLDKPLDELLGRK